MSVAPPFLRRLAVIAGLLVLAACSREQSSPAQGTTLTGSAAGTEQPGTGAGKGCDGLPDAKALQKLVSDAPTRGQAGGFTGGMHEWAAVVNREGVLCAVAFSTAGDTPNTPAVPWVGSKGIAIAKAFTANGFSSDTTPMSTARLYTMSLPGHSLWSAANGNPLNPKCLTAANENAPTGTVCGGTIAFGGGLPLYRGKTRVGGLGVSGDTPCADHEIAKRIREAAGLPPEKGNLADDVLYAGVDRPSVFQHALCPNTWRNGEPVGEEGPALAANGIAEAKPPLGGPPEMPGPAATAASAPASAASAPPSAASAPASAASAKR